MWTMSNAQALVVVAVVVVVVALLADRKRCLCAQQINATSVDRQRCGGANSMRIFVRYPGRGF